MTTDQTADELTGELALIRDTLRHRTPVRIELGFAFGMGGTRPTFQVWAKNDRHRWEKVGPFVVPPEGGDRADLLDMLAGLTRPDDYVAPGPEA